jgi:signal transduction histidine kinase/CheY-like chemotaxis protein
VRAPQRTDVAEIDASGEQELTASITALSELVMLESPLSVTLTHIAGYAVKAIPGADGVGLTLFQDDRPQTVVATAPFVSEADALQYRIGEGPCITATIEGVTVRSGVMQRDMSYPVFGPRVAELGLNSMLSLPLLAQDRVLGSINVYARAENAFDDRAEELGELFAVPAAVAVRNAQALSEAQRLATRLQNTMSSLAARSSLEVSGRAAAEDEAEVARRQSRTATAIKDEFLSRVSHEVRTPLNAVVGFAQLLGMEPLSALQHDWVEHILRGGRQLLVMIEDVFDITAIESDQLQLAPTFVSFTDIVDDAIMQVLPLTTAATVQLSYDPLTFDPPPFLYADPARVRQVLVNLLTNAVKFNHPGGCIEVSCTIHDTVSAQGVAIVPTVSLAVIDTGCGIAAQDIPRLFAPFDRLGHTSDIEGAGIGLALSQRLTTLMGGRLQVDSDPGTGSTFTVTFPLASAALHPNAESGTNPGPVAAASLLYIEDNRQNVELMASILRRSPAWAMVHAERGARGLELARTTLPDLILLDLHLPDIDGTEVLHALKRDPRTADIAVVIVSADASPGQARRLEAAGAQDYLTKPLDVRRVLEVLDRHARHTDRDRPMIRDISPIGSVPELDNRYGN